MSKSTCCASLFCNYGRETDSSVMSSQICCLCSSDKIDYVCSDKCCSALKNVVFAALIKLIGGIALDIAVMDTQSDL